MFINHSFPVKESSRREFTSQNGKATLKISTKKNSILLPYGPDMPTAMLFSNEAIEQQSRALYFDSLNEILKLLSLSTHQDNRRRLRETFKRLENAQFDYFDHIGKQARSFDFKIIERVEREGRKYKIILTEQFYDLLMESKNLRAFDSRFIEALKGCPLALNIFKFTVHRTQLKTDARIKLPQFLTQIGSVATNQKTFLKNFLTNYQNRILAAFEGTYQCDFPFPYHFSSNKKKNSYVFQIEGNHKLIPEQEITTEKEAASKYKNLFKQYGHQKAKTYLSQRELQLLEKFSKVNYFQLGKMSEWDHRKIFKC